MEECHVWHNRRVEEKNPQNSSVPQLGVYEGL